MIIRNGEECNVHALRNFESIEEIFFNCQRDFQKCEKIGIGI